MAAINDENNNAVEHLLLGRPSDAVATLLGALEKSRNTSELHESNHLERHVLYSVEMTYEIPESEQPALPFLWYGRPIAISSSEDDISGDVAMTVYNPQIALAVILYNIGIAVQLECVYPQCRPKNAPRRTHKDAIDAYVLALIALMAVPQSTQPAQLCSLGDRLGVGLLHLATVNNLLFMYAQTVDFTGVTNCLATLSESLAMICHGMPVEHMKEFAIFLQNTFMFPSDTPIRLAMAPAA